MCVMALPIPLGVWSMAALLLHTQTYIAENLVSYICDIPSKADMTISIHTFYQCCVVV